MIILYSLAVALLIVTGQALWKHAVASISKNADMNLMSLTGGWHLIKNPALLLGVLVYLIATVAYIILLSKYKYFQVQSLVVGGSLIFTLIIAGMIFGEQISATNSLGIFLVITGAILIIR